MNKAKCWTSVLVFFCALAVGCGDDDSSGKNDGGPDAGMNAGDAGLAADAAAGTGGTTMSGGTGGSMMPVMTVKCGMSTCAASGLLGGMACCMDAAKGTCGMMSGGMCNPPPKVDPTCPSIMIPIVGMMGSCCAANGMCGLDGSALGMGCVDYKMVIANLGILGGVITLPAAQSCGDHDGGAMPGDHDGGT